MWGQSRTIIVGRDGNSRMFEAIIQPSADILRLQSSNITWDHRTSHIYQFYHHESIDNPINIHNPIRNCKWKIPSFPSWVDNSGYSGPRLRDLCAAPPFIFPVPCLCPWSPLNWDCWEVHLTPIGRKGIKECVRSTVVPCKEHHWVLGTPADRNLVGVSIDRQEAHNIP